jgi:Ni/Co efflux regulator RcnB
MEDVMKRIMLCLLAAAFMLAGYGVKTMAAQEKKEKTAAAEKQLRWHGIIVRINKDQSSMDVRKGNIERKIYFDSSTQWTKGKEVLSDMSQYKEGSDVICLGKADAKGEFHATRVDLRQ